MSPKKRDYAVLDKFKFERKPVGVKYLITRPEGIPKGERPRAENDPVGRDF